MQSYSDQVDDVQVENVSYASVAHLIQQPGPELYPFDALVFDQGSNKQINPMNSMDCFIECVATSNGEQNMRWDNLIITNGIYFENNNQVRFLITRIIDLLISVNSIENSEFIKSIKLYNQQTNEMIRNIEFNQDILIPLCSSKYQNIPFEIRFEWIDKIHVPANPKMVFSGALLSAAHRKNLGIELPE
jgi:hypothetical protein